MSGRRRRSPILPTGRLDRLRRAGERWFRQRDGRRAGQGVFLRRFWMGQRLRTRRLFLVAGLGWMLYILLAGEHGFIQIRALEAERSRLQKEIDGVDAELGALHKRLEAQPGDPFFVERVARERYGLARPGETVYRLPEGTDETGAGLTGFETDGTVPYP